MKLAPILHFILVTLFPALLVLTGVRMVMSVPFLQLEYHRPRFPEDRYGFTQEDRLRYAPYAVRYLLNDSDINYLGDRQLDGESMFNSRELRHMEDVKVVTKAAMTIHTMVSLITIGIVIILVRRSETRRHLRQALFEGGAFTILLIIVLIALALMNWDFFFTGFHKIFFEGDSWQFSTSDTLIRLFPERFWFDAALSIGLITILGALLSMLISWLWGRHTNRPTEPRTINSTAP
jgi:integral membrane protein (TIGR01906 family)